jgi:hypothetical protein
MMFLFIFFLTSVYNPETPIKRGLDNNLDADCIDTYPPDSLRNRLNGIGTRTYMESMDNTSSKFWANDINSLFKIKSLKDLIPTKGGTQEEQLNIIMKLGLIISIILCLVYWDRRYILIAVLTAIITMFMYANGISINSTVQEIIESKPIQKIIESKPIQKIMKSTPEQNNDMIDNALKELEKKKRRTAKASSYDYYTMDIDKYAKVRNNILPHKGMEDRIQANNSQNDTTGGYDWVSASSHVNFNKSNDRLLNVRPEYQKKMFTELNDAVGREVAQRNMTIPTHHRDVVNINPAEFWCGKNMDRHLYYSGH